MCVDGKNGGKDERTYRLSFSLQSKTDEIKQSHRLQYGLKDFKKVVGQI